MESYYTDEKELVCLNCPIISECIEKSKYCTYQKNKRDENGLTVKQRYYRKTHPNVRTKLTDEELRLHRAENQKRYREKQKMDKMVAEIHENYGPFWEGVK